MVVLHRAVQAEDKAARRAAILEAAGRLLARDPENFASVAQVAEEAGLAKGTVYLYFKTKEEMLMSIHAEQAAHLFDDNRPWCMNAYSAGMRRYFQPDVAFTI